MLIKKETSSISLEKLFPTYFAVVFNIVQKGLDLILNISVRNSKQDDLHTNLVWVFLKFKSLKTENLHTNLILVS